MESFVDRLTRTVFVRQSHLCVGLDPDDGRLTDDLLARVAEFHSSRRIPRESDPVATLGRDSAAKFLTCQAVVMAAAREAAAFKPNSAFFEASATDWAVHEGLSSTISSLAPGALAICDAKRGDIGNTSRQYARSLLEQQGFDAITVNPLMGSDSVEPFLQFPGRGVFLLCLTSNPGAEDFLLRDGLWRRIAEQAVRWGRSGAVGLVVGATRPEMAAEVRAIAPELPLLIPGVGAQGGDLQATLEAIDARRNPRFLINASRSIMFPDTGCMESAGDDYGLAVRQAAANIRQAINQALQ